MTAVTAVSAAPSTTTPDVPPVQIARDAFSTHDPAAAHHLLTTAYAEHALSLRGDRSAFSFSLARASTSALSISRVRHSLGAQASWQPLEGLVVVRLRGGALELTGHGQQVQLRAGEIALTSEGDFDTRWTDMDVESFLVPKHAVPQRCTHSSGGLRDAGASRVEGL